MPLNVFVTKVLLIICDLVYYKLTRYEEEATSSFIQAVACKWSSTDDEKPTENHSCHTNEHKDAPESSVDCIAEMLTNCAEPLHH